jgi:CheY-like chemotaxis protein/anti-sigma regulatory factor (Ser/Thr protein kinase)
METQTARVLVVDDEPLNVEILLEYLEDTLYETEVAEDGVAAWSKLQAQPDHYDIVLLDRMMPGMDGMEVLRRIKDHPKLQSVPVILQTALAGKQEITEGLAAGAYYYLTKPFEEGMLLSVLRTAAEDHERYRRMQEQSAAAGRTLGLLCAGEFRLKTLAQARDLAGVLANAFPDPRRVVIGLSELLINAVEHGNLGISYADKSALKENNEWDSEVERRLADPRYSERRVTVRFGRDTESLWLRILDEGDGFDWQHYMSISPDRVFDSHGRGIAMARLVSFDAMEYRGAGNDVTVTVKLERATSP